MVHRVTTSGTTTDNEWYNEWQRVGTTIDNERQWVTKNDSESSFRLIFLFFEYERGLITKHSKENLLNLEEDLLNYEQQQAPKEKY